VGANGSGKTRLGTWFEFTGGQQGLIHRVAAQRSLVLPDSVTFYGIADAEFTFRNGVDVQGYSEQHFVQLRQSAAQQGLQSFKRTNKWQQQPETSQQNDYRGLLVLLFSEETESNTKLAQQLRAGNVPTLIDTKLQHTKRIWESVLPHRQLLIGTNTIDVQPTGPVLGGAYKASAMSDGERVALYLIGQCLTAPVDSIIVADEPEVHLHRAIQSRLWNAIEQARPDCLFVYLTHDLDFAASRSSAKKIWIKSFINSTWDWTEVPATDEIPEDLLLTVLGSRVSVLFTEGEKGGLEEAIFSKVYPDWTITPRTGCQQVIEATQAFRRLKSMHGIDCYGIIDLDYRDPQQVASLQANGVYVLDTQEMENLLLAEPVLYLVAVHAHASSMIADTPDQIVEKVKAFIFGTLGRDIPLLASRKTAWELEMKLHRIDRKAIGIANLERVRSEATQFDVSSIYNAFEQQLNHISTNRDYTALLRAYNNKGLVGQIGQYFGTLSYAELVKRLISNDPTGDIVQALRAAAPVITPPAIAPTTFPAPTAQAGA
jgi:hypothetical protein